MTAKLLVIEDNYLDVVLLEDSLGEAAVSYELHNISDGLDARRYIESADSGSIPDLIVLDLNLPRVDGISLLTAIRNSPLLREVPVLVWSSTRVPREAPAMAALGISGFWSKPSDLDEWRKFGVQIRELLDGSSRAVPSGAGS